MKQMFLEAGKVRNTHALKGEVKFEFWLEGAKPLSQLGRLFLSRDGEGELKIQSVRRQGDVFLVLFSGYDTVEKASLLKGKTLFVSRREADPEGEKVFFADLIGLPLVEEKDGTVYGTVREVTSRGGGELLSVLLPDGREVYFPVVRDFIARMDPEQGVFVHAPRGIFD